MTEKRFTINGKEIIQDKQVWCMANSEHCADVIATAMNELHEENKSLKNKLEFFNESNKSYYRIVEKMNELDKENEQLKEFNKDALDLINNFCRIRGLEEFKWQKS